MAGSRHPNEIATFKNAFDGGTRPNRFVVTGVIGPGTLQGNQTMDVAPLLVKAASMPSQTLGILQVPFRGRVAKLPGDRAYPEWTFTILDEANAGKGAASEQPSNGGIRRAFEGWHESFNLHKDNVVEDENILSGSSETYFTQWNVTQLNMVGEEITGRTVRLHMCWPVEVGAIDLSYDSADTLTEYSVTLAYDYLTLEQGTGVAGANIGAGVGTNSFG